MSSDDDILHLTIKEEVSSDTEDQKLLNSSLSHNSESKTCNSVKNNIKVQVLSYLDIKEEPQSENEDLNYSEDDNLDKTENSEENDYNSLGKPQNLFNNSSNNPKTPQDNLKISKTIQKTCKRSYNDNNLEQIVKIKEEDEFEFKIVELNSVNDDYLDYNQLESIVEFEDEQKTSFRIEGLESYENLEDPGSDYADKALEDKVLEIQNNNGQELKVEVSKDKMRYQNYSLNRFSRNLISSQASKVDGNPKLAQIILNKTQNRLKLEEKNLVLQASNFHLRKRLRYNSHQESLKLPTKLGMNDNDHQTASQDVNSTQSDTNLTSNSGLIHNSSTSVHTPSSFLLDTPTSSSSISSPTTLPNFQNAPKILLENFLQNQILKDSSKIFKKSMKFSEPCYQKFSNLSNILQKLSVNEKLLSKILLKNPSNSPPRQITPKMQIISKSIRLDKNDLSELPKEVIKKFNLRKQAVNFEKKDGQVINMFKIPYYVCTLCLTIFSTQNTFFMHFKALHATVDKPFDCWKCLTSFCTWNELLPHIKSHDDNRLFNCKYCFFPFKFKETLEKHLRTVHVEKVEKISCEICGRNFDTKRDMLTHRNRHARVRKIVKIGDVRSLHGVQRLNSIKCIFCPAQFFKNEALEEHYKTHKALEKMKCRGCGKDVMINPQFIIKNNKMREFKCIKCAALTSKITASSDVGNSVTIADSTVKIEKIDEQETVTKVSTVKLNVKEPKKVMTLNKSRESMKLSVKCYVCGLQVGSNIKLFWHMKRHLEKNEFKCSICREDFDSRESMVEHSMAAHSTTNTTKCKICDKQFHFVDLNTHMKTHMDTSKTSKLKESSTLSPCLQQTIIQPKMIRLNSKGKATSLNGVEASDVINETVTFDASGPICEEFVEHKNITTHNKRHDQERVTNLVQNIQNPRNREDLPGRKILDLEKNEFAFKGTKIILKRKPKESSREIEKRIKLEK